MNGLGNQQGISFRSLQTVSWKDQISSFVILNFNRTIAFVEIWESLLALSHEGDRDYLMREYTERKGVLELNHRVI